MPFIFSDNMHSFAYSVQIKIREGLGERVNASGDDPEIEES